MIWSLTISEVSTLLIAGFTCVATISGILMWLTTRRTMQVLLKQVNHQIASSHSVAQHQAIDAHRELFLGIAHNPVLCDAFVQANHLDKEAWIHQKIAVFLINNTMVYHANLLNGTISDNHWEGFKRDARDVFSYPSVRHEWQRVRLLHSKGFRHFVEQQLMVNHPSIT